MNEKGQKFYFTFGSNEKFPYPNSYLVVIAENEKQACEVFRKHFPDRHENTLNCSFVYTENEWNKAEVFRRYQDPSIILSEWEQEERRMDIDKRTIENKKNPLSFEAEKKHKNQQEYER